MILLFARSGARIRGVVGGHTDAPVLVPASSTECKAHEAQSDLSLSKGVLAQLC